MSMDSSPNRSLIRLQNRLVLIISTNSRMCYLRTNQQPILVFSKIEQVWPKFQVTQLIRNPSQMTTIISSQVETATQMR